jgi:hypothetical protein
MGDLRFKTAKWPYVLMVGLVIFIAVVAYFSTR